VWNTPLPYYWDPGTVYNLVPSRSMISSTSQLKVVLSCSEMSGDAFDLHYLKLSYQYAVWK
jgi:hypothetical protein